MRILITGAAGFIGSHLSERLLDERHSIVGVDSFDPYYDPAIKRRNVAHLKARFGDAAFKLVEGDFGAPALLNDLFSHNQFDGVIHLAAVAGVRPSIEDPLRYFRTNVEGFVNLLEALRKHGPKRLVAASSSSVYGNDTPAPFREDAPCAMPEAPYPATKRAGELFASTYARLYGIKIAVMRPFTVYGPRQRPDMAIAPFAKSILAGAPITVFGDGSSSRDYTYVSDVVDGFIRGLDAPNPFGIYNLAGGRAVSLNDLIAALESATGKKAQVTRLPMQRGDVERTSADLTKARAELGYAPKVSLEEGLRRTVAWVKENS